MQGAIYFPHLGIHLENVGSWISILGFKVAYYGIIVGFGMVLALLLTAIEAKRTKQNLEDYLDLSILTIIFAIIGARLYYVIFSWGTYKGHFLSVFNVRQGGLALYGGIIAAIITVFIFAKRRKLSPWQILDTTVVGLVVGQMVGRWGNFFNREAFGDYTNGLFAMQIPADVVRTWDITDTMREHLVKIKEIVFIQVHPTFLYEFFWCLLLLLILLGCRKRTKVEGELFLVYIFGYGVGRLWIEGLRTDQLLLMGTQIAVSQVLAVISIVVSVSLIYVNRKRKMRRPFSRYRS